MLLWPPKDPDEVLDYGIDWASRLDTDTIATSTWIVPDGITQTDDSNTTTATTIWLSGGTLGEAYVFTNRVTTAGGRTMDQSVKLKITAK
jgi:hypothetical protein